MNFASDNWAGATAPVMAALARHSAGFASAYGTDPLTAALEKRFCEIFEREVSVFFVATGSAANSLALSAFARPGGAIFCHEDAHIRVDECGCPEFLTSGNKLVGVAGVNGKMTPEALSQSMADFPDGVVHHGQVAAVSITQATEVGTLYSLDEIAAIKAVAESRGVPLHMDGARFANALASLGATPAEMTWKAGVDALSFGATKNGCWCAEVIVFFDPEQAKGFEYFRKRAGHLFSKSRFVAAQLEGYLENDNWLTTAAHANEQAKRLAQGVEQRGGRLLSPVQANEVFPIIGKVQAAKLRQGGAMFHEWPVQASHPNAPVEGDVAIRLVTSFATSPEEVSQFLDLL
ncbi:low specificity L-threonine aldolase [Roseibium sp. CAU 1637]|uniref:L-threonine aldolase n=1 Tax=Roseibium limicola TaxID=2816037 RepID=A0A939EQT6_9HYPH|nr:low specificity L-threonine aldolase [Roseibium limicola]MBO0346979.1 low specificity L-threonine aldolase [Roseibium limicola]